MQKLLLVSTITTATAGKLWNDVCTQSNTKNLPFCDMTKDTSTRVADYVQRVTLSQKAQNMHNSAEGIPSLHIPPYQWGSEGVSLLLFFFFLAQNAINCIYSLLASFFSLFFFDSFMVLCNLAFVHPTTLHADVRPLFLVHLHLGQHSTTVFIFTLEKQMVVKHVLLTIFAIMSRKMLMVMVSIIGVPLSTCKEIHVGVEIKKYQEKIQNSPVIMPLILFKDCKVKLTV